MNDTIIGILSDLRPEFDFTSSLDFIEDGFLDSFDVVSLVNELEEKFNILIDGEDIIPENFASVKSIEALIKKSAKAI